MSNIHVQDLLGCSSSAKKIADYLDAIRPTSPEVKSYTDAVYFNYYQLGLSLQFAPADGYKLRSGLKEHDLNHEKLSLQNIYLYNTSPLQQKRSTPAEQTFSSYPTSPFTLNLTKAKDGKSCVRPPAIEVRPDTSAKDFVQVLLEPDRKGGGAGPSSGSIGIWCEWSKDGIMVEFGGDEAKGPHAWEQGKDAIWKIITLFTPTSS